MLLLICLLSFSSSAMAEGQETSLPVTLEPLPAVVEAESEDARTSFNPRFQVKDDETVIDLDTALMWPQNANIFEMSVPWQVAKEYIKEMNAGKRENFGHTDWRIPTIGELSSLFESERSYPALPAGHPFNMVKNNYYWSSTGGYNIVGYAWVADMGSGMIRYDLLSFCNFRYVWPVRSTGLTPKKVGPEIDRSRIVPSQLGISPEDFMCAESEDGPKPPPAPIGISATAVSPSEIVVSWQRPQGAEDIAWFNIYRGNQMIQSSPSLSFVVEDIDPDATQCFTASSYSVSNLESGKSPEVCARTWAEPRAGTVWTSGVNSYGQIGDGTLEDRQGLGVVEGVENIVQIAAGVEHVLVLRNDGAVWAWGRNQRGQIGDGSFSNKTRPVRINGLSDIVAVAAGWYHSLALAKDGTVWAWGRNYYGQLGDGTTNDRSRPVKVVGLSGVTKIAAGWYHSMAIREDGTVLTWGWNYKGQLGTGDFNSSSKPQQLTILKDIVKIDGGMYHSLALDKNGDVWAWGNNEYGQLGTGNTADIPLPIKTRDLTDVVGLAAGMNFSVVSRKDGTVWAWGRNDYSQLGSDLSLNAYPDKVKGPEDVVDVAAGGHHVLALKEDGTVTIWGWNYELKEKQSSPRPLSGIRGIKQIDAGIHFNVVLKD